MDAKEFKAWFEGFSEAIQGVPTEEQWKRIKERVQSINSLNLSSWPGIGKAGDMPKWNERPMYGPPPMLYVDPNYTHSMKQYGVGVSLNPACTAQKQAENTKNPAGFDQL